MLVIPISSNLHTLFSELARSRRMVFIAGLPGVGKTLLIQQLALIANQMGRRVHLIQWDVSRQAFETPAILAKYPERDGVTAAIIRKGVGVWSRTAVQQWHETHPGPAHLLIGEAPLIGNRLIELTQVLDDAVEPLLSSEQVEFVSPIPSWEVREVIERAREQTIANPQHENEKMDASPSVLRALWQEVNAVARQMGLTKVGDNAPYNPYIYAGVYEALLEKRQARMVLIDQILRPKISVYELGVAESRLAAAPSEALAIINWLEQTMSAAELEAEVENWHQAVTANPKTADLGPELLLPLPEALLETAVLPANSLTNKQIAALKAIAALPIDASPADLLPKIDAALAALASNATVTLANVRKFDIYDSYFNVKRTDENGGIVFLTGLLQAYRNMLQNLETSHELTIIELPLLRVALESSLQLFMV